MEVHYGQVYSVTKLTNLRKLSLQRGFPHMQISSYANSKKEHTTEIKGALKVNLTQNTFISSQKLCRLALLLVQEG